jgi:hypothetical protein
MRQDCGRTVAKRGRDRENASVRSGRLLLVAGCLGILAAACGDSSSQYIENEDLGVFAKLPSDWAVYDTEQLLTSMNEGDEALSDAAIERAQSRLWFRGFDASSRPSAEGSVKLGASEPRGFVQISALSQEERDQINVSGLRSAVIGTDPMYSAQDSMSALGGISPDDVEVLTDEPAEFEGGYHGNHNVFAVMQGNDVGIVDQTALLDSTNSRLYLFVVSCDETCYFENNSDDIKAIVDSWTIDDSNVKG